SHTGSLLGRSDFFSLLDHFQYEVVYLMVKAVGFDRERQRQFIHDLTAIYLNDDYEAALHQFLAAEIEALPEGITVAGTKLAQISRYGNHYWQGAFQNLVQQCYDDDRNMTPRIIAHTPFLGYHHFVRIYKQKPKSRLTILMPPWMMNETEPMMGYKVELQPKLAVTIHPKTLCLEANWQCTGKDCALNHIFCGNSYFIDDTINTGSTSNKVSNFWLSEYGLRVPNDRIRVITDLRDKDSVSA
ncbi:MAG: hypothetical protein K8L99_18480, partial [Anaerolineae bacterium]|nr:hypothetical protein [Anaerolineae bacterium]